MVVLNSLNLLTPPYDFPFFPFVHSLIQDLTSTYSPPSGHSKVKKIWTTLNQDNRLTSCLQPSQKVWGRSLGHCVLVQILLYIILTEWNYEYKVPKLSESYGHTGPSVSQWKTLHAFSHIVLYLSSSGCSLQVLYNHKGHWKYPNMDTFKERTVQNKIQYVRQSCGTIDDNVFKTIVYHQVKCVLLSLLWAMHLHNNTMETAISPMLHQISNFKIKQITFSHWLILAPPVPVQLPVASYSKWSAVSHICVAPLIQPNFVCYYYCIYHSVLHRINIPIKLKFPREFRKYPFVCLKTRWESTTRTKQWSCCHQETASSVCSVPDIVSVHL